LEKCALECGVSEKVLFLGFRKDIPELLSLFDVNVIASLSEGFPLALVEAMCAGAAIVATQVGGMKEIGKEGETVLFVPPRNPFAIAEKTCQILGDTFLAQTLARQAAEGKKVFDIKRNAEVIGHLYLEMAKRNKYGAGVAA